MRRQRRTREPRGDVFRDHRGRLREALPIRELLAVVDDVDAKADVLRERGEMKAHVSRADHEELR